MTTEQLFEAFKNPQGKGAKEFGIHAFLASNTVTNDYYPMLAKVLFKQAVKLQKETGVHIKFINLSGESEFRIHRIRSQMISVSSEKVCAVSMKKYLFRPEWEMWQSIQNLDVYDGAVRMSCDKSDS